MNRVKFIDRMAQGKVARRDMLRAAAAIGVGVSTMPLKARAANNITAMEWAGYEAPEYYQAYVAKHEKAPDFSFFSTEEEAFEKIRAGFPADLMHPCTYSINQFKDGGLVKPIDTSRLSNWPDVIEPLKTWSGVVLEGDVVMVPTDWGNSSVLYRTDMVDPEYMKDESWSILFDEKYTGRVAPSDGESNVEIAGLLLGMSRDDIFHMTDEQMEQVRPLLERQTKVARFYWTAQAEAIAALASGEIVAAYAWNDAVKTLTKDGIPVKYAVPKEGIFTWLCGLTLLNSGEGDEALTYDFLDAWLSPETGKYMIEEVGYGHGNRKSFELAAPEALAALGFSTDPTQMLSDGILFQPVPGDINTKYINLFNEIQAMSGT
ncbi:MAG: extracellular solute-binding protein [Alphaproteobacteria bacterium]|nr:extracellular solute-binding protein [Alphaproteobacteria bacterium]